MDNQVSSSAYAENIDKNKYRGEKVKRILKKVSKVLGILLGVVLVLYLGFQLFLSIFFKPHDVRLTNVTDTSFTVSWMTNYPMRGVVYYKEKDSVLPGPLSWIGADVAYDDRDVAKAEKKCVDSFNKKAKVSEDFVVDTSNYNCDSIKVRGLGNYFTHHVTLKNLDSNKEYYFRVGDGLISWKKDINKSATFYTLNREVKAPAPIFGKVVSDKGNYVNDSIVYIKFVNGYLDKESIYYSSVTADNGSWYLDGNNIRTIEGEPIIVEEGQDMIKAYAQYENYTLSDPYDWVYGNSSIAYPDLVVSDEWEKDLSMNDKGYVKGLNAAELIDDDKIERNKKVYQGVQKESAQPTGGKSTGGQPATGTPSPQTPPSGGSGTPSSGTSSSEDENTEEEEDDKRGGSSGQTSNSQTQSKDKFYIPGYAMAREKDLIEAVNNGTQADIYAIADVIGIGNAVKMYANSQGRGVDVAILEKFGLAGTGLRDDIRISTIVGNMSAISGMPKETKDFASNCGTTAESCTYDFDIFIKPGVGIVTGKDSRLDPPGSTGVGATSSGLVNKTTITQLEDGQYKLGTGLKVPKSVFTTEFFNHLAKSCGDKIKTEGCNVEIDSTKINLANYLEYYVNSGKDEYNDPLFRLVDDAVLNRISALGPDKEIRLKYSENSKGEMRLYLDTEGKLVCEGCISSEDSLLSTISTIPIEDDVRELFFISSDHKTMPMVVLQTYIDEFNKLVSAYNKIPNNKIPNSGSSIKTGNSSNVDSSSTEIDKDVVCKMYNQSINCERSAIKIKKYTYNPETKKVDVVYGIDDVWPIVSDVEKPKVQIQQMLTNTELDKAICKIYEDYEKDKINVETDPESVRKFSDWQDILSNLKEYVEKRLSSCSGEEGEKFGECVSAGFKLEGTEITDIKGVSDSVLGVTDNNDTLGSGYITYLPEYGFYDMEVNGLIENEKVEGGENNLRIFYIEMNGIEGLQFPADPDNPKVGEDYVLRSDALDIKYKKSADVMKLNLKQGVNLISFDYIPKLENDEYTKASSLVKWLVSKGVEVEHFSYFSDGRWKGLGYVNEEVTGEDFSVTPGRGYLIYSTNTTEISIPGYKITSSVPITLGAGWNLVGVHGYSQIYTARSLLDSINKVEGLTANNISWWPTSKGKYEGLQLTDGQEYGFDYPISSSNGYFIRINKFEPKDTNCGSLLWHEGGSHNGKCANSKSM